MYVQHHQIYITAIGRSNDELDVPDYLPITGQIYVSDCNDL